MPPVLAAIAATLGAQTLCAFAVHSPSVFGPVVTRELGIAADRVGYYVVINYAVAMLVGLASPSVIKRYGPARTVQLLVLLVACGLAIGSIGTLWAIVLAAIVVGAGNGLVGPVSSQILAERSPASMMNFIFSLKQTGVPVGAAIAGATVPVMILLVGWRATLAAVAAIYLVFVIALQPLRAEYDRGRDRSVRLTLASAWRQMRESVAFTWRDRQLRELGVASGIFVGTQLTVVTYSVSFLNLGLGQTLVAAGFVFSSMQVAGILGRLFWGAVGDRMRRPRVLLGALGVAAGINAVLFATMTSAWPVAFIYLVAVAFGLTGVGWNGLYFAEIAKLVKREQVTVVTGGGMFFSFLGGIGGPVVFALVVPTGSDPAQSFALGFALIGVLAFAAGARLIVTAPRP